VLRLPSPPLLGLDISPEAVKIVELSASRGRIRVENADSENLPAGAVNDREVLDVEVVTHTIRSILERSRIRTKAVATALPSNAGQSDCRSPARLFQGNERSGRNESDPRHGPCDGPGYSQ
jgi:Tfp pilus assembly PilM family ATPase